MRRTRAGWIALWILAIGLANAFCATTVVAQDEPAAVQTPGDSQEADRQDQDTPETKPEEDAKPEAKPDREKEKPDEDKKPEAKPDEATKPDQAKPEAKPDEDTKPDQKKPEAKPDEDTKPDQKKPEAKADEDTKPEAKAAEAQQRERLAELERQMKELAGQIEALKADMGPERQEPAAFQKTLDSWIQTLQWRSIGPANMGGRIVALAVYPRDPNLYYVATASGGLLKTENNGITFTHLFDRESTVSIGDVCVAPSDKNIVWVGTGEQNPRNSVSYGDGVYKSTDGGKTWTHMGLKDSYQIGRIVIHPENPDIVYVGALGRLFGPSPERGLFKTTDGGKTWEKILFIDDKTGVIDVQMNPRDPNQLLVATYQRQRGIYDEGDPIVKWGPGGGIHRTTDGGKSWTRVEKGLPTVDLGRIGLSYYAKDPKVVFAIVESQDIGKGPPREKGVGTAYMGIRGDTVEDQVVMTQIVEKGPAEAAGLVPGDVIESIGGKALKSYENLLDVLQDKKPGDKETLKVKRGDESLELSITFAERPGGSGGDPERPFAGSLGSQRENVQDRQGKDGFQTGGVYRSGDGGVSWTRINSLNPRPMYFSQIRVDPSDEKRVYVLGIALYRSEDGGKSFKSDGGRGVHADHHAHWIDPADGRHMIVGSDGGVYQTYDRMTKWDHLNHMALGQFYHVALDSNRDYRVYGGLQDNGTWGGPSRTHDGSGPVNSDWVSINGGDGFQCQVDPEDPDLVYATSQYGGMMRRNLRTGQVTSIRPRPPEGKSLRFNWNTPFILSPHNPRVFTCAGNYVFRSLDRGDDPKLISPEITRTDKGSATALAESPRDADVLYVGTDDGALWVTRNGGRDWIDIAQNLGVGKPCHVASIEASRYADGRVYVALNGRRSDLDEPFLLVSEDYGQTWKNLGTALPRGSSHCLREDVQNADLLFAGTEFSVWVSIDRGQTWNRLNSNLPTVAVHEIAIHPTAGEIVAATHGRSLYVLDVTALRQFTPEKLAARAALYRPREAVRWLPDPRRGRTSRSFEGENPPSGLAITYSLTEKAGSISLRVLDAQGKLVRSLRTKNEPGLHLATWDLTRPPEEAGTPVSNPLLEILRRRALENVAGRPVPTGTYQVVLTVGDETFSHPLDVESDPSLTAAEAARLERARMERPEQFLDEVEGDEGDDQVEGPVDH